MELFGVNAKVYKVYILKYVLCFIKKHTLFTLHVEVVPTYVALFVDIQVGQGLHP